MGENFEEIAKEGGGFILKQNRHPNVAFAESGTC